MDSSDPASTPANLISASHLAELGAARRRSRKLRRAVGVARLSGWSTGLFGALTLLGGLFGGIPAALLGSAMIACGVNELHAASRLRDLNPAAPRRLALNQLALCAALCAYCAWNLRTAMSGSAASLSTGSLSAAGADQLIADVEAMSRGLSVIVYAAAIVLSLLVQSLTALYYLTRARLLSDYLRATPDWVIQVQKAA